MAKPYPHKEGRPRRKPRQLLRLPFYAYVAVAHRYAFFGVGMILPFAASALNQKNFTFTNSFSEKRETLLRFFKVTNRGIFHKVVEQMLPLSKK